MLSITISLKFQKVRVHSGQLAAKLTKFFFALDWLVGHPLRIERYPNLKHLFQTHKSKAYNGWYNLKDLFWYDETPRTIRPAHISPSDVAEIHLPRFSEGGPMKFTHESVVQSALRFGSVGPFSEKRVHIVGDLCLPEFQTSMLACIAYGSFMVVSTFWFRAVTALKDMKKEQVDVLVTSPSHLNALVSHHTAPKQEIKLETIVVINTPHETVSEDLIQRAKQTFGSPQVDSCFITDGCVSPFLYASNVSDGQVLGKPISGSEVQIGDSASSSAAVGTTGGLWSKGYVCYIMQQLVNRVTEFIVTAVVMLGHRVGFLPRLIKKDKL